MANCRKGRDVRVNRGSSLHDCQMQFGYYAPRAFAKLLFEGVVFGSSRAASNSFFCRLMRKTRVTCGRCGARMLASIWTRDEVASLFDLGKAKGLDHLGVVMCREYDGRVLTCAACNHVAHLAWDEPSVEDPSLPF